MSEQFRDGAHGDHVVSELSAYMDGQLISTELERVRLHIEKCASCHTEYIELRATKQLLVALPIVVPPKAFTLTEEMVAPNVGFWQRLLMPRNAPRFATGSVLAFVLLFFVLTIQLVAQPSAKNAFSVPPAAQAPASDTQRNTYEAAAPTASTGVSGFVSGALQPTSTTAPAAGVALPAIASTPAPAISDQAPSTGEPQTTGGRTVDQAAIPTVPSSADKALPQSAQPEVSTASAPASAEGPTVMAAIEGALVLLGIALGVGAILARRRV
jgi:anti-sigma factor RsiW